MFYTLLKFLGWGLLLAFIGGCIGWALRALKARTDLARARSSVESDEAERLRERVADLEQVVAERDRLRIQLADVRHADSPGIVGADIPPPKAPDPEAQRSAGPGQDRSRTDDESAEAGNGSGQEAEADSEVDSVDRSATSSEESSAPVEPAGPDPDLDGSADAAPHDATTQEPAAQPSDADSDLDLEQARAVLGKTVVLDDLTVVEGIGPKISELCSGVGIATWRQLADTDVDELQSILDAAGSRYSVHKPATWSHQAELLATGQWSEFLAFTEELKRGK